MTEVVNFGDAGWLLEVGEVRAAHALASIIERAVADRTTPVPHLSHLEITVGFGSVVVSVPLMFADTDPSADDFRALDDWVA